LGPGEARNREHEVRQITAALVSSGWLWLAATGAGAETYHILSGTLTDPETGRTQTLVGSFEARFAELDPTSTLPAPLLVDDFEFRAGDRSFARRQPIGYQGLTPSLFLEAANQIQVDGDRVGLVHLRSGGEWIAAGAEEVTYRFLDFRSDGVYARGAVGHLGDGPLPRRLHLEGTLREVDQSFRMFDAECGPPPLQPVPLPLPAPPPPEGDVTIRVGGGDGAIITWDEFDISPDDRAAFVPPGGATPPLSRVTGGDASSIEGQLRADGSVYLVAPPPLALGPVASGAAPTLEELGITAPAGAGVTFTDAGVLTVIGDGDLLVEGGLIDIPGLTSLVLVASGDVVIAGALVLPPDVTLRIEAGGSIEIEDGSIVPDPGIVPICRGLRAIFPAAEREVGRFSLVATAARPADIDVDPWSSHDRVRPGRRQPLPVALLGSEDLDVRDVDARSLRLGPGEAAPWALFGRRHGLRVDVNRDHHADLVARFSVREAEIAFGDRVVCLVAETADGSVIEGCDEIDTIPR
jgi:filamentous hemagglutinin family protein